MWFSFTCQGVLNPLCAFVGGFIAQEAIKAITQKFTPIDQWFYYDATEVVPLWDDDSEESFTLFLKQNHLTEINSRYDGL
jgi:hypothetical protein